MLADPPRRSADDVTTDAGTEPWNQEPDLQPIRRMRRDKKEPLIAVVGRPNVVSLLRAVIYNGDSCWY